MKILTSPSVLACDFLHLEDEIRRADAAGSDWLHCDVMDGMFVPNMSFGFDTIRAIDTVSDLPLDVHMMTCVPQNYLDALKNAGADIVTIHNDIGLSDEQRFRRLVQGAQPRHLNGISHMQYVHRSVSPLCRNMTCNHYNTKSPFCKGDFEILRTRAIAEKCAELRDKACLAAQLPPPSGFAMRSICFFRTVLLLMPLFPASLR